MKKSFSRREVLGLGAVAGAALIGSGVTALANSMSEKESGLELPWQYKELDIEKTKARAYSGYYKGGCMYGVFESIAAQVAEKLGEPYTNFPFDVSVYGGGGVALWGTICGTCNGAAMAIGMFHQKELCNKLINEVYTLYENTPLPVYVPEAPVNVSKDFKMAASKANTTLCHISITRWTRESGFNSFDPERAERCARLVSDMAGFTAGLLNEVAKGDFKPKEQISEEAFGCLDCHAKGSQAPNEPGVLSRMNCVTCHDSPHDE